jgi:hypothetical protein
MVKHMSHSTKSLELSSGQAQFAALIQSFPWLAKYRYWDWDKRECAYETLKENMGVMSHGEQIIAQFFLGVWRHNDQEFDILEAASVLDRETRQLITGWFVDPFWP